MVLKSLSDLKNVIAGGPVRKLVLAAAQDQHSLGAVIRAWKDNIIEPILIGDKEGIQNICEGNNYDISGVRIIHEPDMEKAVEMSVKMVSKKEADVLMKGKVGTSTLLKSVLNKEWGLRTGNLLSHFALFEVDTYHKVIAVTDVAMNIAPDLQDKIAIINNSVSCLIKLGYKLPKVAVLGAVEMVNENMEATLHA
ncbi:MAG: phosphate acyltransferase, partial [Bacteroidales bacterium]